jgi:hypothetical protein
MSLNNPSALAFKLRYSEVFGDETTTANKQQLAKRIAWQLQVMEQGDLSERTRRREEELANDPDLRMSPLNVTSPSSKCLSAQLDGPVSQQTVNLALGAEWSPNSGVQSPRRPRVVSTAPSRSPGDDRGFRRTSFRGEDGLSLPCERLPTA